MTTAVRVGAKESDLSVRPLCPPPAQARLEVAHVLGRSLEGSAQHERRGGTIARLMKRLRNVEIRAND